MIESSRPYPPVSMDPGWPSPMVPLHYIGPLRPVGTFTIEEDSTDSRTRASISIHDPGLRSPTPSRRGIGSARASSPRSPRSPRRRFELRDVFDRVAASIRRVLPFEHLWAWSDPRRRLGGQARDDARAGHLHGVLGAVPALRVLTPAAPAPGLIVWDRRCGERRLDAAFPVDQDIIASGSAPGALGAVPLARVVLPAGSGSPPREPHAFSDEHQAT